MSSTAVLGCIYGDEAKAKIVDVLAENKDAVVRFQGGSNAGHTIKNNGKTYILHIIPSGILYPEMKCVLGSEVVINPFELLEEMTNLNEFGINFKGRFYIDPRANIVLPVHKMLDSGREADSEQIKIGTTKRGIGPCYADKAARVGLKIQDLKDADYLKSRLINLYQYHETEISEEDLNKLHCDLLKAGEKIKDFIVQVPYMLNEMYDEGKDILFEGAQGTLLDITYGTYPFVTSSHTVSGGICIGTGMSPHKIDKIVGVYKSYFTRVGEGPFPTELFDEIGQQIRDRGNEYGSTTGRPRRCGWFDAVSAKFTAMINGVDVIALTLVDVLRDIDALKICTAYKINGKETNHMPADLKDFASAEPVFEELPGWSEDISGIKDYDKLPENARKYIERTEELLGIPIKIISVGPDRTQTIFR
ncbi:MAG: adenylosuccinate synthase [Candidatus Cloacimonadota bacterium]|nr:MAG: adenylosuccinate synthase [Candidatus Cloacimonadota bacterium]